MKDIPVFNFSSFSNNLVKMNQRIFGNYLKNYAVYHHDLRDIIYTYIDYSSRLYMDPTQYGQVLNHFANYYKEQILLFETILLENEGVVSSSDARIVINDKRFVDEEWTNYPYFSLLAKSYLLLEKLSKSIIDQTNIDHKLRRKLRFYSLQYLSLLAPTNFLLTNPTVLKLAMETNGKSLWTGFNYLVQDLERGKISQIEPSAFEVGVNLAVSPGAVVFENEIMQLIQYSPTKKTVFQIPLILVPPWINKYYILDLQPKNSFVNYLVNNGLTVFIISWRNPKSGKGNIEFKDYVTEGAIRGIEIVKSITGSQKVNTLGYCIGGTLLSIAGAILSKKKDANPINSITFLASMIDFSDIGPMGDIINTALVSKLERGELINNGVMKGEDMETAFNLIRPNDLIWKYVVSNYLKGIKPAAIDVMYWTNDNTNLPAAMYIYYMRYMILENKLSRKNELLINDVLINVSEINCPVIVIGMKDDNISPAITTFTTTKLVSGPVEFILAESGHVIGAINPPSAKKYGFLFEGILGNGFEEWVKTAKYSKGSWWKYYIKRIGELSGAKMHPTQDLGSKEFKVIEAAPGKFVKEKC
jgi:polyhydroxyalkanoate synthase